MPLFLLLLSFFFSTAYTYADTIYVTATRDKQSSDELAQTQSVLDGAKMESSPDGVKENLNSVPGLLVQKSGGVGQPASVFIRGTKSEHTLVLIDGIAVNDPLSTTRSFDFGQIPSNHWERVEILRGPQSVLYGTDALGGVIHFISKKEALQTPTAGLGFGSFQTVRANLDAYGFYGGYEQSRGFSAADRRDGNPEPDGYHNFRLGGRKEIPLGENTLWTVQAMGMDSSVDTDKHGGAGGDSLNTSAQTTTLLFRTEVQHLDANEIEWDGAISIHTREREDNTNGKSNFKARYWKTELLAKKSLSRHKLTVGSELWEESGISSDFSGRQWQRSYAFFVQDQASFGRWHGTIGYRYDRQGENVHTSRASLGYWILKNDLRAKANWGTGFKSPSIYQKYSSYGNLGLRSENSTAEDFGLEWNHNDWTTELTVFENHIRHLIDFEFSSNRYKNFGRVKNRGIEYFLQWSSKPLTIKNSMTVMKSLNQDTGQWQLRRAAFTNNTSLEWKISPNLSQEISGFYSGSREDIHSTLFTRQTLPGYFLLSAQTRYQISKAWRGSLALGNLLNRYYQEISGYGTAGFHGFLAVDTQL